MIDLDIQSFFDTIDRTHLAAFLDQRARDGVIRRTIGKCRKGRRVVKRQTAKARFSRAVRRVSQWCRQLRGHAAYYGISGNSAALSRFRYEVHRCWRKGRRIKPATA